MSYEPGDEMMGEGFVSSCCSAPVINPGMVETGICSSCGEHCGFVLLEEEEE